MRMTTARWCITFGWMLSLILVAAPASSIAQEPVDVEEQKAQAEQKNMTEEASDDVSEVSSNRSEATRAELQALHKLIQQLQSENTENKERITELETQAMQDFGGDLKKESQELFLLNGFFDLTLHKLYYNEDSPLAAYLPRDLAFALTDFFLYLKSNITDSLSVLGEIRFSFLPHGSDEEYKIYGLPPEGLPSAGIYSNQYRRTDTTVTDPSTTFELVQGGLTIERIHLTYAPTDWFNVIAGRFLTPFGIWNIDHGSPAVLSVRLPYLIVRKMVPLAQTGLQVYGRLFPTERLFLDYALTLSNGRGPLESYSDLDDNKGIGLKLALSYNGDDFSVSGGAYGYYGKYTDNKKVMHILGLSEEATADWPVRMKVIDTHVYDEYAIAYNLLVELFGVRIQGEYVFSRCDMLVHLPMGPEDTIFRGASPIDELFTASSLGQDFYLLLGYELPLYEWLGPLLITPYLMYEYGKVDDTSKFSNVDSYLVGVNTKPSSSVTLKFEGAYVDLEKILGTDIKSFEIQLAVSF